jgi:RNA polymerase sigma factor (sigma-70 family)
LKYSIHDIANDISQRKDRKILDWLYAKVYPRVKTYILANNGSSDDSKDVFQEAIMALYNLVLENKYDKIMDVEAFMMVVSRNKWIDSVRKNSKQTPLGSVPETSSEEGNPLLKMIDSEKWKVYQSFFQKLSDQCQEILSYVLIERKTMLEIADKLGLSSADAAKTTNYRCKQKLIELIAKNKEMSNVLRP